MLLCGVPERERERERERGAALLLLLSFGNTMMQKKKWGVFL